MYTYNSMFRMVSFFTPVRCCQGSCHSSFTTVFNFFRHLRSYHVVDNRSINSDEASNSSNAIVCDNLPSVEELDMLPIHNVQLRHFV
jgi:hypothetical protein